MAHIEAIGGAMSTTEILRGRTIGKVVSTVTKSLRVVKNIQPSKIHAENSVHRCHLFLPHQVPNEFIPWLKCCKEDSYYRVPVVRQILDIESRSRCISSWV